MEDDVFVNSEKNSQSAVAYRGDIRTRRQRERMLERLYQSMEDAAAFFGGHRINETVLGQMPFLDLKKDRDRLKILEARRPSPENDHLRERQLGELRREIQIKEQIRRSVMGEIARGLKEDVKIQDWDVRRPFVPAVETDLSDGEETPEEGTDTAGKNPPDEEKKGALYPAKDRIKK